MSATPHHEETLHCHTFSMRGALGFSNIGYPAAARSRTYTTDISLNTMLWKNVHVLNKLNIVLLRWQSDIAHLTPDAAELPEGTGKLSHPHLEVNNWIQHLKQRQR